MRALAEGSYYTYLGGRIAGEVAVIDSQGPAVPDRSAVLQEICTQQLVQNGRPGISSIFWQGQLAMGSYYTYHAKPPRIAGEVAVFDSQDPDVKDRPADLCK